MTKYSIPFNRPSMEGNEYAYITQAVAHGHISGDGEFTRRCQALLESELGVQKALLTTSCTHALEMTALLLDIQPGDEIILPAFTFVSTVNAFVLRGARPIFIDVRPDTLNLDESRLEKLISSRTKAIVVMHYAGVGCEMNLIMSIAKLHGIAVIEDNAHGLFAQYQGRYLGTFGCMSTLSFHETKNFTCGEGGALLINDPAYIERAEIIREKGTNRSRYFRGQVDKYTWVDIGSSYLLADVLAAILYAQLEAREQIISKRQVLWEYYYQQLADWAVGNKVRLPIVPEYCKQPYHLFYLLMPTFELRQNFIEYFKSQSILSVFHYLPLHLSPMGQHFGGKPGNCPVAEDVSARLVRLPFYNSLNDEERARVVSTIRKFNGYQ